MSRNYGLAIRPIKKPLPEWIDLGLPSGNLWRRMTLGATVSTEAGLYYAWGETTGYADAAARNAALGRTDGFTADSYAATGGAAITDTELTLAHDAAYVALGNCKMPNSSDFQELFDNCDCSRVRRNNKYVWSFTSRINGKSIIIPPTGAIGGNQAGNVDSLARYWVSTKYSTTEYPNTYSYSVSGSDNLSISTVTRYGGQPIRPIKQETRFVDLDLPSGLLWADRNLGALTTGDYGMYFQWGDTEGHARGEGYNFSMDNYNAKGLNNISADLTLAQDAANAALGGSCRMPNYTEVTEFINNTTRSYETSNGVQGVRFTSKTNSNSIFFPACGYGNGTSWNNTGVAGRYWTSSFSTSSNCYNMVIDSGGGNLSNNYRFMGMAIRAVK